jgi:plasmid stabilization system protein ParE
MKVRLSSNARSYLRKETEYLRLRSPTAAKSFVAQIKKARQNIGAFNGLGAASQELPLANLRRLIVGDYLIDYEIGANQISIVAIRHGRQLPPTFDIESNFDFEAPEKPFER